MEPITHILAGACISRAGLNRKTALATATLVIAAEATDIDLLYNLGGRVLGFEHHRGWTHSFAGLPVVAAMSIALVWGWQRLFRSQSSAHQAPQAQYRSRLPVRWRLLYCYACLAALSHLLLDYATSYGIRLFEPFSYRWYSWDILFVREPYLWLVLGLGLAGPVLFERIGIKSGSRQLRFGARVGAAVALLAAAMMFNFRNHQHRFALAELKACLYDGEMPLRVSAYAYAWNPFIWHGVVETPDFYETLRVDTLHTGFSQRRRYCKPKDTTATIAAKESQLGRAYLDWARYPVLEIQPGERPDVAFRVWFYDLRSIYRLYAYVDLDKNLQVLAQRFDVEIQKQKTVTAVPSRR